MKEEKKRDFWKVAAEIFPESRGLVAKTKRQLESRAIPDAPTTLKKCQTWGQAWLYIFQLVDLDNSQFLAWKQNEVVRVVFEGKEFNDEIIEILKRTEDQLGVDSNLRELRLIGDGFSKGSLEWLVKHFPRASVRRYSEAEANLDPNLFYANPDASPFKKIR